jgi:hypothetical protein
MAPLPIAHGLAAAGKLKKSKRIASYDNAAG